MADQITLSGADLFIFDGAKIPNVQVLLIQCLEIRDGSKYLLCQTSLEQADIFRVAPTASEFS